MKLGEFFDGGKDWWLQILQVVQYHERERVVGQLGGCFIIASNSLRLRTRPVRYQNNTHGDIYFIILSMTFDLLQNVMTVQFIMLQG